MNTDLRVAVCTNRSPDAALEALRPQVAAAALTVVVSGRNDPAFLSEPRPGLSHARNRALAWAAEVGADALAFVDDDAVVDPGWYETLRARWDEAPGDVACIGGPIRPRFSVPPPPWFSDGIAHVLTLLDRGASVRDLDPDVEAVYGANISFRVDPLRAVGGFDPSLGHSGSRAFFGEEDEAQRALVRLGYRVRYVPDAGVTHVIPADRLTRASFVRRRYAFGKALGARGGRSRVLAARQALASGGGAAVAGVTGRDALAMERVVRAAENLGVLVADRRG
jgi:GT2 family glycosyltransferase